MRINAYITLIGHRKHNGDKGFIMTLKQLLEPVCDEIKPGYFYETWHIDVGKDERDNRYRKSYGLGNKKAKVILERMLHNEMYSYSFPHVLRTGVGVTAWLKLDTIPEPLMKSVVKNGIELDVGSQVHFVDEGTFVVKGLGEYKGYPWVLLTSLENGYNIAMSIRVLNHRILRKGSSHKNLNFTLTNKVSDFHRYWYTVGYLLKNKACLSIRTTPNTHDKVIELYKKITGTDIGIKQHLHYNPNEKTFTDNASLSIDVADDTMRDFLYFPKNKVGKREGVIKNGIEQIHNTEYIWTLFTYGFYLGDKHNIDKIIDFIYINANDFYEDFKEGYNV